MAPRHATILAAIRLGLGELAEGDALSSDHDRALLSLAQEGLERSQTLFGLPGLSHESAEFTVGSTSLWAVRLGETFADVLDRALPIVDPAEIDAALLIMRGGVDQEQLENAGGYEGIFGLATGRTLAGVASGAIGSYDLPMPQPSPVLVAPNIDRLSDSWQIPRRYVRDWASTLQATGHLIYAQPAVRARLEELAVATFTPKGDTQLRASVPAESLLDQAGRINVDALFRWFREDRSSAVVLELEAIAAIAHACGWLALKQTPLESPLVWGRLFEIVRRRQNETSIEERWASTWFGMPFGPISRPDALAIVEAVAGVCGAGAIGEIWARPEWMPSASALAEPANWLGQLGPLLGVGDALVKDWRRRTAAFEHQDPRGGRPEVPGDVPSYGRHHVRVLETEDQTLDEMRESTNLSLVTHPDVDQHIADALRGQAAGLVLEGRVSLNAGDHEGGKHYFGGLLAGHLLAYIARERGGVHPKLQDVVRIYTTWLGGDNLQQGLALGTESAAIRVHDFLLTQIERQWPGRTERVSLADEQLICAWLIEQMGLVPSPAVPAKVAVARLKRSLGAT